MIGAGDLTSFIALERPLLDADGVQAGWEDATYTCRARIRYLRGGEAVIAGRLAGRQPVVVTIRRSVGADAVGEDWRLRDLRRSVTYNIRSIVPTEDRAWLEITAESGVAT